jgi:hypothetical protein
VPSRDRPGRRRMHRRDANACQHGRCRPFGATTPSTLRPALATGAVGAPACSARRLATQRALWRDDSRSSGGVLGLRTALPHRSARRTTAYVASANTNATTSGAHPGRHVPVARDPSASAGDESSQGSTDELPPATSHGYEEWDFSGVPDPVMFRLYLDAMDYWFGYSDDSSAGSYDPARLCCVVITNDQANAANAAGAGDVEVPPARGLDRAWLWGQAPLHPHHRGGPTSTRSWPRHASLRPSSRRSTARSGCFEPPSLEKPPRAANAHASWADGPVTASMPT